MTTKKELNERFGLTEEDYYSEQLDDHIVIRKSGVRKMKENLDIESVTFDVVAYKVDSNNKGHAVVSASGSIGMECFEELGEASPENNKFPYPVAVAQKRAESRLVLRIAKVDRVISEVELDSEKWFIKNRIAEAVKGSKR